MPKISVQIITIRMKYNQKYRSILWILVFILSIGSMFAQENVNASGGDIEGSGGSTAYSVGQMIHTFEEGAAGSVAHGVQQPFEISTVTSVEQANGIELTVSTYPNPVGNVLFIDVDIEDYSSLSYRLISTEGTMLIDSDLNDDHNRIDMSKYAASVYFLKIFNGKKEIKVFKIIKK